MKKIAFAVNSLSYLRLNRLTQLLPNNCREWIFYEAEASVMSVKSLPKNELLDCLATSVIQRWKIIWISRRLMAIFHMLNAAE